MYPMCEVVCLLLGWRYAMKKWVYGVSNFNKLGIAYVKHDFYCATQLC